MLMYFGFPILITVSSMIWCIVLLKKHNYVLFLPWTMAFTFLIFGLGIIGGVIAYDEHRIWIFKLLNEDSFISTIWIWVIYCIIANFCTAFVLFLIAYDRCENYIKWQKKYIRIYMLVTLIPVGTFLILWFHYRLKYYDLNSAITFLIFEFVNIIIFLILQKYKNNIVKHSFYYFNIGISIILFCFLVIKKEELALGWYFSYGLFRYLILTVREVKRSKEENYPEVLDCIKNKKRYVLIHYIPFVAMIVSCIILTEFY